MALEATEAFEDLEASVQGAGGAEAERLLAEPLARGIAQAEVWDAVSAKSERRGTFSPDRRTG